MARRPVNPPTDGWSLTVPLRLWTTLEDHLFGDGDEHGAVLLAGSVEGPRGPRLLAREVLLARDGIDYVPGETGYRALTPTFVRDAAVRARAERLHYLAVHNHFDPGTHHTVGFSATDLASHIRGYPALRQITGKPVGAVVLTRTAAAGDLWLPDGSRADLAEVVIPAGNLIRMRPHPAATSGALDEQHDRQGRLFGELGQRVLARMRVAVIGLGGVGSILVEGLARLGVGELLLVDDDIVDITNLPRLLGAERDDVDKPKTVPAVRNARRANPGIRLEVLAERVETRAARAALRSCDWIFLAADGQAARFWVNATVNQYLVPATQIGVKVPVNVRGDIGLVHAVSRFLLPGHGCLWCNELINPTDLAVDMHPEHEREAARYVPDVPAPSVVALNGVAAMEGLNHFMLAVTGLHVDERDTKSMIYFPLSRQRHPQLMRRDSSCNWCSELGQLARGD